VAAPVRLQTHVWNPLGDRRALLLHGLTSDGACWWRLASQLADDGWMVLAPDLRGHGRSPAAIAYDLPTLAADVELLGDGWQLVVGHSLGGAIAAHLLARSRDIAAAVLLDPVLVLPAAPGSALHAACGRRRSPSPRSVSARSTRPGTSATCSARSRRPPCAPPTWSTRCSITTTPGTSPPWSTRGPPGSTCWPPTPSRAGCSTPALAARSPTGERVTTETVTCGHSIQREAPATVSQAVARVVA
jgi:pimeloyl-ACP methyl ester carboxylesterase